MCQSVPCGTPAAYHARDSREPRQKYSRRFPYPHMHRRSWPPPRAAARCRTAEAHVRTAPGRRTPTRSSAPASRLTHARYACHLKISIALSWCSPPFCPLISKLVLLACGHPSLPPTRSQGDPAARRGTCASGGGHTRLGLKPRAARSVLDRVVHSRNRKRAKTVAVFSEAAAGDYQIRFLSALCPGG